MSRGALVLLLATTLTLPALAGCLGAPADEGGPGPATDPGPQAGPSTSGGDGDGQGPGGEGAADGDTSGGADGNGSGAPPPRTPDDAMPGVEPAETGEGWAHFVVEGRTTFAFKIFLLVPDVDPDTYDHNLTVLGDETLIEVALTWDDGDGEETDEQMVDLNLQVLDDRQNPVASGGGHGQAFIDQACGIIGECIFLFPPNGTTWEYLRLSGDKVSEAEPGAWTIRVTEGNNWNAETVQGTAGLGEGHPFRLDVWVYTVPTDAVHHPAQAAPEG